MNGIIDCPSRPICSSILLGDCSLLLPILKTELPSFELRRWCPVDVGIKVNLFLFEFNCTIVDYKPTATEELSPSSTGLDLEAKSRVQRQAGDDEKHLILVGVQTEATGQVTAMAVAGIK